MTKRAPTTTAPAINERYATPSIGMVCIVGTTCTR
jgi:hypothetical protein